MITKTMVFISFFCYSVFIVIYGDRMIEKQKSLDFTFYSELYDIIIPQDHILRKFNDLVDFSFIYEELESKYCLNNGRNAIDPVRMFKYLLLKVLDNLSDVDVVERSRYDMSYKFFLGMAPEDPVIDPSSLTKFRKLRLKDSTLLDLLIIKTVKIALEKGVIKKKSTIIVDSTHTKARYNQKSQIEILRECSKGLRKSVYAVDESIKDQFPAKNTKSDLQDEIEYSQELIEVISKNNLLNQISTIKEKINLLKEKIDDDIEHFFTGGDEDARVGHKTVDTSFFGYKSHLAMTEERIITAAVVTSGDKNDGKQLHELLEKSKATGVEVETVVGDSAYSGKSNIELAEKEQFKLVSRLNPIITNGGRGKEDEFEYNKDAGMFVCKAGHMAIRKAVQGKKKVGVNQVEAYYFDVKKCCQCKLSDGCYKPGAKSKTYSVTIRSNTHEKQAEFQKSDFFKSKSKERYKIEAKNSELKNQHGYDVASSKGIFNMELQGAMSIFVVNLKRIVTLMK